MTITPTDPTSPATPAGLGAGGSSDAASAADFLAVILQALAPGAATPMDASGRSAGQAVGQAADQDTGTGDGALIDPSLTDASLTDASPVDPSATGLVVPAALVVQLAAAALAGAAPTTSVRGADVAPGADVPPTDNANDIYPLGDAGTSPPGATPHATTPTVPTRGTTVVATTSGESTGQDASAASTDAAGDSSGSVSTQPAPVTAPVTTPVSAAPTVGTVVPAGMTPVPATATDVTATHHVTRQVFPEVTSLVARGDGAHRITLTLKPEALGEVRVVMTVRDGAVHVRLAAGHEAQQALREGSPELTRLLEAAGASDSRVVVRDLPASTSASASTSTSASTTDLGTGGNRPQDQHAGTRAHQPATDGTHDGTRHRRSATGATSPRSNEPVTHTRTAGVDVTM